WVRGWWSRSSVLLLRRAGQGVGERVAQGHPAEQRALDTGRVTGDAHERGRVPEGVLAVGLELGAAGVHEFAECLAQLLRLADVRAESEVVQDGQRGLGDGAALADPAEFADARGSGRILRVLESDPKSHLVPAGGVDLERLPVEGREFAGAVALARVVEDDLLVALFDRLRHGPLRRSDGPCRAPRRTPRSPPRWCRSPLRPARRRARRAGGAP